MASAISNLIMNFVFNSVLFKQVHGRRPKISEYGDPEFSKID